MPYADPEEGKKKHSEYMRDRYKNDPEYREKHKALVKKNNDLNRRRIRRLLKDFRASGCLLCSESEECCLSAHHLSKSEKNFTVAHAQARRYSHRRVKEELAKCVCVCENCHRKIHAGIITTLMRGQLLVEQGGS